MKDITLEELLEAGCHFGHQVTRNNPKSKEFIFEARDNIHIIDLVKTKEGLEAAAQFVYELAKRNGSMVVVGTKRQVQAIVAEEVQKARNASSDKTTEQNIFFVNKRWLGGTFTNFSEVSKNYKKLKDITIRLKDEEEKIKYTKKEIGIWEKERQKLQELYGGVSEMKKIPDAVFVIDTHMEQLVVQEAKQMGVAIVGIVDTNADPTIIDYPIPANDDAVGSLKLIVSSIIDAWIEGKNAKELRESKEIKEKNEENKEGGAKEVKEKKTRKTKNKKEKKNK